MIELLNRNEKLQNWNEKLQGELQELKGEKRIAQEVRDQLDGLTRRFDILEQTIRQTFGSLVPTTGHLSYASPSGHPQIGYETLPDLHAAF